MKLLFICEDCGYIGFKKKSRNIIEYKLQSLNKIENRFSSFHIKLSWKIFQFPTFVTKNYSVDIHSIQLSSVTSIVIETSTSVYRMKKIWFDPFFYWFLFSKVVISFGILIRLRLFEICDTPCIHVQITSHCSRAINSQNISKIDLVFRTK